MTSDNLKPLDRNSWPTLVADHAARMISKLPSDFRGLTDPDRANADAAKELPSGSAGVPPLGNAKHEG